MDACVRRDALRLCAHSTRPVELAPSSLHLALPLPLPLFKPERRVSAAPAGRAKPRETAWRMRVGATSGLVPDSGVEGAVGYARRALGLESVPEGSMLRIRGTQELMGMNGDWELTFDFKGRFAEVYVGSCYSSVLAFDGTTVWETDAAGRVLKQDLDDVEVSIFAAWFRTGFWSCQEAQKFLDFHLATADDSFLATLPPSLGVDFDYDKVQFIVASFPGRKTSMYIAVDATTYLPLGALIKAYGTAALARLGSWSQASPEISFHIPLQNSYLRDSGDIVSSEATHVELIQLDHQSKTEKRPSEASLAESSLYPRHSLFHPPRESVLHAPIGTFPVASFDASASPRIEAYETPCGHVLVRPKINGQDVGFFILDTGASTLTIEPAVADKLGMRKFGSVHTVTVNGPSQCSFREGTSFELGPLHICNPRFVDVAGATLAEEKFPVAGICGFDVFHHCTVHLKRGQPGSTRTLELFEPSRTLDDELSYEDISWLPMRMLSSTPHCSFQFRITHSGPLHEALFLLDTGAAGTDLIFNSAATKEFGLWPKLTRTGFGVMRGMGGQSGGSGDGGFVLDAGRSVTNRTLAEVTVTPSIKVRNASAIVLSPDQGNGLQLSAYTAGLACNNLLQGCDLIFDYANKRLGVATPDSVQAQQSQSAKDIARAG